MTAEVAGVRTTYPNRVMYPSICATKLDLARYYETIAPWRQVVEAARVVRETLNALGLRSFVTRTGGQGSARRGAPHALRRLERLFRR